MNGAVAVAQPPQADNHGQNDSRDNKKKDDKKRTIQQQAEQQRAARQRTTQQRTEQQRAEQQRVTQQRTEQQRTEQQRVTQQRATQRRVTQQRTEQQRTEQQRVTQRRAEQQRWSRGDRLPDQYRQDRYAVSNWQHFGLQPPPHGYRWYRDDDNDFFLVVISSGLITSPVLWSDRSRYWNQNYRRTYGYDDDLYYRECRTGPDPAGILAGALIGALIGNTADHRDRTEATIAGIIIGGAAGAALTSHMDCDDRSYAYRVYSSGFNDGRIDHDYDWYNPGNGHRGTFRITRYYYDRYGFRCASFRQTLDYRRSNDRRRNGRACLQPNGAWVIVQ